MKKHIMYNYTEEDHSMRLNNLRFIEKNIKSFKRKHLITDYLPAHYVWDEAEIKDAAAKEEKLKKLADDGVQLIQLWEMNSDVRDDEGNIIFRTHSDPYGKGMFRPKNAEETKKFIKLVHKYGMKIIPYTSTNFFMRYSPGFDSSWAAPEQYDLGKFSLAHCSVNVPGWREKILKQFATLLDEYDFDGVYIDAGYLRAADYVREQKHYSEEFHLASGEIIAFEESDGHDGGMQDILGLIYGEVKRRGKILKLHKEGFDTIHSDFKVYDYLWVGECVSDVDVLRKKTNNYDAYVIPDHDFHVECEHERYLNTIPFMQFPFMQGNHAVCYKSEPIDWSLMIKWLSLYKKMTVYGSWAYVDITMPKYIKTFGDETVVSAFVNTDLYIVIANYSYDKADNVELEIPLVDVTIDEKDCTYTDSVEIAPRQMRVLRLDAEVKTDSKKFSFSQDGLESKF